jgi:H+/Cl- antiporter ClcA
MAGRPRGLSSHLLIALFQLLQVIPVAVAVGSASAFFLWSLDLAAASRFAHPVLLYFLPLAGLGIGLLYRTCGESAEGGNNLIFDQIHDAGDGVPRRMAPLILFATVATHWFGGSAGREGTAVQIGGSLASGFGKWLMLGTESRRILLMAGIAAGFGAIFGTPFAGAVFALEVLLVGRLSAGALMPCLVASFVADWTCHAWGAEHTPYAITSMVGTLSEGMDLTLFAKIAIVGIAAGLVAAVFTETTHGLHAVFARTIPYAPLRPFVGGLLVIGLTFAVGTREYLGLGVWSPNPEDMTISTFFTPGGGEKLAWLWKIIFTALTLSCGFKGGEVTPLFFIGAALGYALSGLVNGPVDLLAAVGFVAIFAGATNTPIASTVMGMELFGMAYGPCLALGCGLAFLCSGTSGIYLSQRVGRLKRRRGAFPPGTSLREIRAARRGRR